ncbi:hypothetical protein ES703_49731 [subsurface metagenome]
MTVQIIKACSIPLAMVVVGVLAWHAMSNGIDGAVFMSAVVVIGGLGGYEVKSIIDKRGEKKSSG